MTENLHFLIGNCNCIRRMTRFDLIKLKFEIELKVCRRTKWFLTERYSQIIKSLFQFYQPNIKLQILLAWKDLVAIERIIDFISNDLSPHISIGKGGSDGVLGA